MTTQRKRGRRPRVGRTASKTRFAVRLAPRERARWQRAADRLDLTLAELVRAAVELAIAGSR